MLIGNLAKAKPPTTSHQGAVVTELLGLKATVSKIPHSHLVVLRDGATQEPHFHEIDQFQVVVAGAGRIGAHEMSTGHYHYTDRATPYGPIAGADEAEGLSYVVLRPRGEEGVDISSQKMPESRHLRSRPPGRHLYGDASKVMTEGPKDAWQLAADHGDGGMVCSIAATPGTLVDEPAGRGDSGPGYTIVLEGSFTVDGEELDPPSVVWVESTDPWPAITAGPGGGTIAWFAFSRDHIH